MKKARWPWFKWARSSFIPAPIDAIDYPDRLIYDPAILRLMCPSRPQAEGRSVAPA
jgi:hypothetical protein